MDFKTIILTPLTKIKNVVSKNITRPGMDCVLVLPKSDKQSTLVATDGRIAAITTCDGAVSKAVLAPGHIFPVVRKKHTVQFNGQNWLTTEGKGEEKINKDIRMPRLPAVMPPVDNSMYYSVCIDASLLFALAGAITDKDSHLPQRITLHINKKKNDVGIPITGTNGVGILMPLRSDKCAEDINIYNKTVSDLEKSWDKEGL